MDTEIKFRVDTVDKARFERSAEADGRKLSDWVRRACFAALPEFFEGSARPVDPEWQKKVMEVGEPKIPTYPPGKPIMPASGPGVLDPEIHAMVVEADELSGTNVSDELSPRKPLTRAEREARMQAFDLPKGKKR